MHIAFSPTLSTIIHRFPLLDVRIFFPLSASLDSNISTNRVPDAPNAQFWSFARKTVLVTDKGYSDDFGGPCDRHDAQHTVTMATLTL